MPGSPIDSLVIEGDIIEQLRTVYDPEIPVNIYEMGLIYGIDINGDGDVNIKMTLTSPACPAAVQIPGEVEAAAKRVDGVQNVYVDIVWDPSWTPDMMSEAARLELGMF